MNRSGKLSVCLLLTMNLFSTLVQAAVTATVDRQLLHEGDSLTLVLRATQDEDISQVDVSELERDFEILHQSTRSSTNIINGRVESTREVILELFPRRAGPTRIPAFRGRGWSTAPIALTVQPPVSRSGEQDVVTFEAVVDRSAVYVQGQLLLTLRLQQAVNLDNRSVSELAIDGAFVVSLEQKSFQRQIDGRPHLVHELRYAVFPEKSGTLTIPEQVFTARQSGGRRTLFDRGGSGRSLRRTTQALSVEVLPRPADYNGPIWLPARALNIEENWSTPPDQLAVGESATRTITLSGVGMQSAQLPPVLFQPISGLKYYPDQPSLEDQEDSQGLTGVRTASAALIPTAPGNYTIPEVRIPWWDTENGVQKYAVLPARTIAVAGTVSGPVETTPLLLQTAEAETEQPIMTARSQQLLPWQIATGVGAAGWLLTTVYLWRRRPTSDSPEQQQRKQRQLREVEAFRALEKACRGDDQHQVRRALLTWGQTFLTDPGITDSAGLCQRFDDPDFSTAVSQLNQSLYGSGENRFSAADLLHCVKRLRKNRAGLADSQNGLQLYPTN